jgi:hypothetical protein
MVMYIHNTTDLELVDPTHSCSDTTSIRISSDSTQKYIHSMAFSLTLCVLYCISKFSMYHCGSTHPVILLQRTAIRSLLRTGRGDIIRNKYLVN